METAHNQEISSQHTDLLWQDRLQRSEQRFQVTFEQAAVGMAHVALDGHWLQVNQKICKIVGYTREELLKCTFQAITHPDDLDEDLSLVERLLAGEIPTYTMEKRYIRKDGSLVWINLTVALARDEANMPQYFISVIEDIDERKRFEAQRDELLLSEQRAREETEVARQQLAESLQNLQDLNANLEAIVTQRTAILRQLNIELQRSNQELQNFAYVASHDLQEPLRKIQAFGNLLEEEYGPALSDGKAYLDRMRNAAGRMRVLIDDLLTFSRVTTKAQPFTQIDLAAIVYEIVDDLEPRLKATQGRVEVGKLPTIVADYQQMHQLFQNLLVNAVKFYRSGVPPLVRVYAELHIDSSPLIHADPVVEVIETGTNTVEISTSPVIVKQQYQIFVEDNGIGFDEKYLDRIFAVFQRLHSKSEYEGTGIGLAIVRKIVERHGGTITARSSVGQGTTFIVTLPVLQSEVKEIENLC